MPHNLTVKISPVVAALLSCSQRVAVCHHSRLTCQQPQFNCLLLLLPCWIFSKWQNPDLHIHSFTLRSCFLSLASVPVEQQPEEAEEPEHLQHLLLLLPQLQCGATLGQLQLQHQLPASTCGGERVASQGALQPPPVSFIFP